MAVKMMVEGDGGWGDGKKKILFFFSFFFIIYLN